MVYLFLIVSLIGIVVGANQLISGSVALARRFHLSDFVIGAVIVGIGTSFPELFVSTLGAVQGSSDIAIGNVVGSNIFNILGILGITAIFFPIAISRENMRFELPLCFATSLLAMLLTYNFFIGDAAPQINRWDGAVLLLCFVLFFVYSLIRDKKNPSPTTVASTLPPSPLWLSIVRTVGGLAVLIISCDYFVEEAIIVAREWGLSEAFISVTLIACGTSLPELAASIASAYKKNTQMALGNVIGSNIFNATLILGLSAQVTPLTLTGINYTDYIAMVLATIIVPILGYKGKLNRWAGIVMFACFIGYVILKRTL